MKPLVTAYEPLIKYVLSKWWQVGSTAVLSGQQHIPRQKAHKSDGGMQVNIAYSFQKAKSGPINHKVNLKKVSLVDGNFDVGSVVGRMQRSHEIISRLCG